MSTTTLLVCIKWLTFWGHPV